MTNISDTEFRQSFFAILTQNLSRILLRQISPDSIIFSTDEKDVIEYFFKDVSPEPISQHASKNACVDQFCSDLQKLSQGDPEKTMVYMQAFKNCLPVLDTAQRLNLRILFGVILRKMDSDSSLKMTA